MSAVREGGFVWLLRGWFATRLFAKGVLDRLFFASDRS